MGGAFSPGRSVMNWPVTSFMPNISWTVGSREVMVAHLPSGIVR